MTQTVFSMVFTASFCMLFFVFARVWRNQLGKRLQNVTFLQQLRKRCFLLVQYVRKSF